MRLLVVEDHAKLAAMIVEGLLAEGHTVEAASDGMMALDSAYSGVYDVIILDLMLPKLDGISVLQRLRGASNDTPVLILTAMDEVAHRVAGLDAGADDYLVKPFAFGELLARLRALARRRFASANAGLIKVGDLEIDLGGKRVRRAGETLRLTAREFSVLECLAIRKGRVVSKSALLDVLYAEDDLPESNVVEVYVRGLRRKLQCAGGPELVHTRRGLGYVLEEA